MDKISIGLYGAGGFGKEVMSLLPTILSKLFPEAHPANISTCFIDDNSGLKKVINKEVLSLHEFASQKKTHLFCCITIADPHSRKLIASKLKSTNIKISTLIFNETLILDHSRIGTGSIIMPGATISTSVIIGMFTQINFNSYIAHDCKLENFVTISPFVACCGNTVIREGAFIGAGSIIKQGSSNQLRYIGINSVLGMGSNLLTDLPDNKTYVGNPAADLKSTRQ